MRKIIFITVFSFVLFLMEFLIYNLFGRWLTPDLLLILIIFINLVWGIRFSILTAVAAGIIRDSFSSGVFGLYLLSFVAAAYLTTIIARYLYHPGSKLSRFFLVSVIAFCNVLIQSLMITVFGNLDIGQMILYVLFPEVVVTAAIAPWMFRQLRQCALKLSA